MGALHPRDYIINIMMNIAPDTDDSYLLLLNPQSFSEFRLSSNVYSGNIYVRPRVETEAGVPSSYSTFTRNKLFEMGLLLSR